jgi:glycosyltransferase involved in cell wall biosynthesis
MANRQTLSVAIPTKNAADLLRDCLASVTFADEIIVVDMHSTDDTEEVCGRYSQCHLIQHDGYIFENVNIAFDAATSDWVMRLDTDERITPELAAEIQAILHDPPEGVTGFEFWECAYVLGRRLEHGRGSKHFRKCMFRRGAARYPVQHEHEDLQTSGTWLRCEHPYVHLNYATVAQYLEKINYYTDRDLERLPLPERAPAISEGMRETLRAFYLYYLRKQGFRDGWVGLVDSSMHAVYQLVYWAKTRERWERQLG